MLFVITVELLDDEAAVHLRDVAGEFGKSSQTLVLINKAGSMKGDPEMRRRAVIEAWGPDYPEPPVLQCDAADYLTSLSHSDPIRAEQYRATSGIPQLREAIDLFALERGDLARLQQPLQAIRTAATEAQSALADDPEEAAVLALLARQRRALTTRRQRIETLLETIQVRFLDQCLGASEVFADSVESVDEEKDDGVRGRVVNEAQVRLRADLDIAAESFGDSITNAVVHQMEDLASEVLEIEASPHSRVVLDLPVDKTLVDVVGGDVPQAPNGAAVAAATSGRGWMEEVMGALNWFNDSWGAGGGVRESAGTLGHQVVKDVGHLFDVKFKPWQAVRVANYIGKAAKVASVAIPVVLAGVSVVQEDAAARRAESARHARRQRLITEVHTQARQISDSALNSARQQLDRPFSAAYDRIDEATRSITESQGARSDSVRELNAIRAEAGDALARLRAVEEGPVAIDLLHSDSNWQA